jgi:8-oxo-dGTP pyrophosphatase MutT (NUDIX family)
MYISSDTIRSLELKYGTPAELKSAWEMTDREFEMVRGSQKHGRAHDATLFIIDGGQICVIRKPMYPPGAFRPPSGGVAPGEDFEAGALREAQEETGLTVRLDAYLLRSLVRFTRGSSTIDWTSHVFSAVPTGGRLEPQDTVEIVEARFISRDELLGSVRQALLDSGSTGLRYRAMLADSVMGILAERGVIQA